MLIIVWTVKNPALPRLKPIELCGKFNDLQHFQKTIAFEKSRGWETVNWQIIKENLECMN